MPFEFATAERLGRGRERAVGDDAGGVGGGDDGPDALGPELRRRAGGRLGVARRHVADRRRLRQAAPVLELLGVAGDRRGPLGEAPESLVVEPVRRRDADPLADDEPEVHAGRSTRRRSGGSRCSRTGSGCASSAIDEDLGLGRRLPPRRSRGRARRGRGCRPASGRSARRRSRAHHLPTPTWTFRNRAPGAGVADAARPGRARPCRSSACRASRSSIRRRPRRRIARTRT